MKKLALALIIVIAFIALHFTTMKEIQTSQLPISSIKNMNINTTTIEVDSKTIKAPYNKDFIFINSTAPNEGDPEGTFTLIKSKNIFGIVKYSTIYNDSL